MLLQDSYEDNQVLDDFGLLTLYRDLDDDEVEAFEKIPSEIEEHGLLSKDVQKQVKRAALATLNAIRSQTKADDAIKKCAFLKSVSKFKRD